MCTGSLITDACAASVSLSRTRGGENLHGPERRREKKNTSSLPDAAPKRRLSPLYMHRHGGRVWKLISLISEERCTPRQ